MANAHPIVRTVRQLESTPARFAIVAGLLALLIGLAPRAYAQYVPIPNYTGIGAGQQFRNDLNNHLAGASAIAPRLVQYTYAQLPAEQDGQLYWCKDCQQVAPCASGGAGALAIGTQGQWSCSTGGGGGGASVPINSLPPQTGNYSANSYKIVALLADSAAGDALSNSQSTMNSLAAPVASVAMNAKKFTGLGAGSAVNDSLAYGQINGQLTHNQGVIAIVSQSTPQQGSGTSVALSPPSGITTGNVLLILIQGNLGATISVFSFPSGFTNLTAAQELGNPAEAIACKTAASESGNYTVAWTGGTANYVGQVIQLAGTSCANIDNGVAASASNAASLAIPSFAVAHENDLVLAFGTNSNGGTPSFTQGSALFASTSHGDGGIDFTQSYGNPPSLSYINNDSPSTHAIVAGALALYSSATITSAPIVHGSSGGLVNDLSGSFNQVINVESPFAYIAGTNGAILPMGATGDGNHDDTVPLQNAILAACGMTSLASPQMYVHYGHPRVVLPYTGANGCYKITQPLRLYCSALDFGSDPGGSNVGGAHATLCPNFAGPAVIAEGGNFYNPTYATSLLAGSGNSFVSSGSSMPIVLSDWLNSARVNFNADTQFGVDMTVNLSSLGANGNLFAWALSQPGRNNSSSVAAANTVQMSVNSSGKTICSIDTTGSGVVSGTSTDTGFSLNATHTMSIDWNGSNLYCFRDGNLVVGPLAATGSLFTSIASGNGVFNDATMPDVQIGYWPDQQFNNGTTEPVGKFDALVVSSTALHTAAYTPSASKPAVTGNTQLIVNFPSTCTAVGQSGCSTDGTILGQTSTGLVASGNVFLPLRSQQDPGSGEVPFIHLHDLELCGSKNFSAPDGLFAIWAFGLELDHVSCSNANNTGFNLYSNEWNAWVHDGYVAGSNHHLGWEFGNAYNESHDQNLNDNGGIIGSASVGASGGQYDEYFQHDGAGISVYDWMYENGTRFTSLDFSTDDGGSEPNHVANFHLDGNSGGEIIDGQFQMLGSGGLPIEEWNGTPITAIGTQFVYAGVYPAELVNHTDASSNTHLPSGPDTFIGVQIPRNSGNPIALSNPAGWVLDLGDQNGGDTKPVYHGTVGSGAQAVPAGATNLDGHTFRVNDGAGTAASPSCTAGSSYAGAAGTGRCEVSYKSGTGYIYTGLIW